MKVDAEFTPIPSDQDLISLYTDINNIIDGFNYLLIERRIIILGGKMHVYYFYSMDVDKNGKLTVEEVRIRSHITLLPLLMHNPASVMELADGEIT